MKLNLWVREYDPDIREWVWVKTTMTGTLERISIMSKHPAHWILGHKRAPMGEQVVRIDSIDGKPTTQYDILSKVDKEQERWLPDGEFPE